MPSHPVDNHLASYEMKKYLESKKEEFHKMLLSLNAAYMHLHEEKQIDRSLIENVIWEIIRADATIAGFFWYNDGMYYKEYEDVLKNGTASKRIVKMIMEMLEHDFPGDFVKYGK